MLVCIKNFYSVHSPPKSVGFFIDNIYNYVYEQNKERSKKMHLSIFLVIVCTLAALWFVAGTYKKVNSKITIDDAVDEYNDKKTKEKAQKIKKGKK